MMHILCFKKMELFIDYNKLIFLKILKKITVKTNIPSKHIETTSFLVILF